MSEEIKLTLEIDGVKSERSISYNQYKLLRDVHGLLWSLLLIKVDTRSER